MCPNTIPLGNPDIQKGMLFIKRAAQSGSLIYTDHAQERMAERMIETAKVENCLCNGVFIEHQMPRVGQNPRLVIYDRTDDFYVVVALNLPECVVLTAANVDWNEWERDGEKITRKSRNSP